MIYGIGINDIKGDSSINDPCRKIYTAWKRMFDRCYSSKFHKSHPTYIGTIVSSDWYYYSNFKEWYLKNYKDGYQLDKDIIGGNKKLYSSETCSYVPKELNYCLLESDATSSIYYLGVIYRKRPKDMINDYSKPYRTAINKYGKSVYVGVYETASEAHKAWQIAKKDYLLELIDKYKNDVIPEVIDGLQKRVDILIDDIENSRITETINKI